MSIQFHETGYGKRFFEFQLPSLIKELSNIGEQLEKSMSVLQAKQTIILPTEIKDNTILEKILEGGWNPVSEYYPHDIPRFKKISEELLLKEANLLEKTHSADATKILSEYKELVNERTSIELDHIFIMGYQTAIKLIFAGLQSHTDESCEG